MNIKVFVTVASLDPSTGGPARSVPSLGEAVYRAGAEIQFFTKNREAGISPGNKFIHVLQTVKPISKLAKTVNEPDHNSNNIVIHNHGIWLPLNHCASVVAQRFGLPLVISPRGMLEPWARSYRSWKKDIAWYLYQRRDLKAASVLHATSEREIKNLQALGFHLPIALLPNGVELPPVFKCSIKPQDNKKIALFMGRIHPVKGLVNLVQAWAKVRPQDWQLLIAGPDEGGHKADVEKEIRRQGLTDLFSFIGSVEEKDKWGLYSKADLFILPSHSENFGIVVAEALASGLPVITTKGAPWAELEENKCGWWVDIGVEPLATALKEATGLTPEARHEMGLRGRRLVEKNYSWDKIGKEMLSVYEWVLGGGTPPSCVMLD